VRHHGPSQYSEARQQVREPFVPTCTSVTAAIGLHCPIEDNTAYSSPLH
jgi:hypothetical protein